MGYLLAAYAVVLGTLSGYAVRLARRRRALLAELTHAGHDPRHRGDLASPRKAEPGSPGEISG